MRLAVVVAAALALALPAAVLADGVPGWTTESPRSKVPEMDFAMEGLGDGVHKWQLDFRAACDRDHRGEVAGESWSWHSYPHEPRVHVRHGRFVFRRFYRVNSSDVHFTIQGHRVGKHVVGTFHGEVAIWTGP